ncbi:MAG: hypothetical protein HY821_20780 [Acidobacteria bacterium]|nr:hypothetical protein [Acidobacteriota bacterium]
MRRLGSLFILIGWTTASAADWYVPAATSSDSGVSRADTHLRIYNPNDAPVDVDLSLIPSSGTASPAPKLVTVAPGQMASLDALLTSAFPYQGRATLRLHAGRALVLSAWSSSTAENTSSRTELQPLPQSSVLEAGMSAFALPLPAAGGTETLTAGVVLIGSVSQVDVLAFDESGAELGRKSFSGPEQTLEAPVSTFVPAGAQVARMNFLVRSGRAIGYALLENGQGPSDVRLAQPTFSDPVKWYVSGARKLDSADGLSEQFDLRLFNLAFSPAQVTLQPTGDTALPPATVTVGPRQTLDIRDLFGTLYGASTVASAGVIVESEATVLVAARQFQLRDGSAVFGESLPARLAEDLTAPGTIVRLLNVRNSEGGPRTQFLLQAGPSGMVSSLAVKDPDGNLVLQADGPARGPNEFVDLDPESLLPGNQWPAEAILEIAFTSGSALAGARTSLPGSSAPSVAQAVPDDPYDCPAPVITVFSAFPPVLATAGTSTLAWSVDADTARLLPAGTAVPLSGESSATIAATTTYTLEAANACGTVSQPLTITVGAPRPASVAPASASPGALISIQTSAVEDASAISGVNFTFGGQLQSIASIEEIQEGGLIRVRVPFIQSSAAASGYLTGAGTIALNIAGTATSTIPFTILPLPAGSDPVEELRQIISFFDQAGRAMIGETADAGGAASTGPAEAALNEALGVLRRAADEIAATGSAQVPQPPLSAPVNYTVTRDDLSRLFSLMHLVNGPGPLTDASPTLSAKSYARSADFKQGPCIQDEDKLYKSCLAASFVPTDNIMKQIQGWLSNVAELTGKLPGVGIVSTWIDRASMATKLVCYLAPLVIDGIEMGPSDTVPIGRTVERNVLATYKPYWNKQKIVDDQMAPIERRYKEIAAARKARGENAATVDAWYAAKVAEMRKSVQDFADYAQQMANSMSLPGSAQRRLGRCELAHVNPTVKSYKILRRREKEEDNTRTYKFRGGAPGGDAQVNAWLDYSEIILYDRSGQSAGRSTSGSPITFPVQVGKPKRSLTVTSVTSSRQAGPTIPAPGGAQAVKRGQTLTRTATIDSNRCTLRAIGVNPTDFSITLDTERDASTPGHPICNFELNFSREQSFDNDQDIVINASISGRAAGTQPNAFTNVKYNATTNGAPSSLVFNTSYASGAAINSTQPPLTSKGASSGSLTANVDTLGNSPSIHIQTTIRMPDNWEEK